MIAESDLNILRFTVQLPIGAQPLPENGYIRDIRRAAADLVAADAADLVANEIGINFNPPGPVRARILQLIEEECVRLATALFRSAMRGERTTHTQALIKSLRFFEKLRLSWYAWRAEWEISMGIFASDPILLVERELARMPLPGVTLRGLRKSGAALGDWPRIYFNRFKLSRTPSPGFVDHPQLPPSTFCGIIFYDNNLIGGDYLDLLIMLRII